MDRWIQLGAALLLASCDPKGALTADNLKPSNNAAAETNDPAAGAPTATMSLLNTTWEFDDNGKPTVITIDKTGAYIENRADGTQVVHGTYQRHIYPSAQTNPIIRHATRVPRRVNLSGLLGQLR